METREFTELFGAEVRSLFNWGMFESRCKLDLEIVTTREELSSINTVWYEADNSPLSDWRVHEARRKSIGTASRDISFLPSGSQKFVEDVKGEFKAGKHPRVWGVPVYRTEDGELLLLDGNHRSVALLRSRAPIRLILVIAYGYDSEFLMPDLLHAVGKNCSAEEWSLRVRKVDAHFADL